MPTLELLSEHACFGGVQRFYRHDSTQIGLPMRFGIYLPPKAAAARATSPVPLLVYLAGLSCNEETFAIQAGAQRHAARYGLALLTPDTSPRGANVAGESDCRDFGVGASFYLDAVQPPWRQHWRMESYITKELLPLVAEQLPLDRQRVGIFGHSMGGHGALTLALRHPGMFRSVSAFAPVAAPVRCPWGRKAFSGYLGPERERWRGHDASELMTTHRQPPYPNGILIDQGLADQYLIEQLYPEAFEGACGAVDQPLVLRRHAGYDHGYYFIQSFVEDHIAHHVERL